MREQGRSLIHLEMIRIIAIWFVVFNHTWTSGFMFYSAVGISYRYYYPLLSVSVLCKIAVPLFFMISGALLLGREESYRQVYGKRVLRIVIVLILFSLLEYCYKLAGSGSMGERINSAVSHFSMRDFVWGIYSTEQAAAYWYLYAYLAFLMMLPLLRRMVREMKKKDYLYLIILHVIFCGVCPVTEYLLCRETGIMQEDFNVVLVTSTAVFYPLLGYFMEHVLEKEQYTIRNMLLLISSGIIAVVFTGILTTHRMKLTGDKTAEVFHSVLIFFPVIAVYFTVKYLCGKHKLPGVLRNIIASAGSTVFGIMLFEDILRKEEMVIFESLQPGIGIFAACIVWVTAVVVSGSLLTWLLKRLPGLRELL